MSNQSLRQASFRAIGSTTGTYEQDALAAFAAEGVTVGTFNERMLKWINARLSAIYANLPGAMNAFAVSQGANNWDSLGTFS